MYLTCSRAIRVYQGLVAYIGSIGYFASTIEPFCRYYLQHNGLPTVHLDHSSTFEFNGYLDKNSLKSQHHSSFQVFSKVSGPWTDRGHPVERTYCIVERTYRHVDTVTHKIQLEYVRPQSADQTFSTVLKNWTKMHQYNVWYQQGINIDHYIHRFNSGVAIIASIGV